jgi:hypothetical protein
MKNGGFQFLNVSRKKQSAEKPLRVVSKTFIFEQWECASKAIPRSSCLDFHGISGFG